MFWITITKTILLMNTVRYPQEVSTSFRQYLISTQVLFMILRSEGEFVTSLTQSIHPRVVVSDWFGIGPGRYRIGVFFPHQGVRSMGLNVFTHDSGLEVGVFLNDSEPKFGVITREYP